MNYFLVIMRLITILSFTLSASTRYNEMESGYCGSIFQKVVAVSDTVCSVICSRTPSCVGFGYNSPTDQLTEFSLLDEIFPPFGNGNNSCNISNYALGKPFLYVSNATVLYKETSCYSDWSTDDPSSTDRSPDTFTSDMSQSFSLTPSSEASGSMTFTYSDLNSQEVSSISSATSSTGNTLSATSASSSSSTTISFTSTTTKTTTTAPNPCMQPHIFPYSNYSTFYASSPITGTVICPSGSVITGVGLSSAQQLVSGTCVTLGVPNTTTLNSYAQIGLCGKWSGMTFTSHVATAVASSNYNHTCSPLSNGWNFSSCTTDTSRITPATTVPTPVPTGTLTTTPNTWMLCPKANSSGLWAMTSVNNIFGSFGISCQKIFI